MRTKQTECRECRLGRQQAVNCDIAWHCEDHGTQRLDVGAILAALDDARAELARVTTDLDGARRALDDAVGSALAERASRERYDAVIAWYADINKYDDHGAPRDKVNGLWQDDLGARARAALGG